MTSRGSSRWSVGTLLQALGAASGGGRTTLAIASDLRTGLALVCRRALQRRRRRRVWRAALDGAVAE